MAQWVKHLVYKPKSLSSGLREEPATAVHPYGEGGGCRLENHRSPRASYRDTHSEHEILLVHGER